MTYVKSVFTFASILIMVLSGCGGDKMAMDNFDYSSLKEVPASKWQELSTKKIYFGHQSVGANILDGVRDIMREQPQIKLNIIKFDDLTQSQGGALYSSRVGKNADPKAKITDFEQQITSKESKHLDVALMKLCYVDIKSKSRPKEILDAYNNTIKEIKGNNPSIQIIHVTAPLTIKQTGPKTWIKKVIGKSIYGLNENIKRFEYNQMLLNEYNGKDMIFDLAKSESTRPDGGRVSYEVSGNTYYSLAPEYTNDGCHLNELGRKKVAEQLLLFLANQT